VKSASDVHTIVSKTSQKEFNKREVLLVDENASISVTLWGQQVHIGIERKSRSGFFSSSRLKNLMVRQIQSLLSKELKSTILKVYLKRMAI
jgi:hypothetical protein